MKKETYDVLFTVGPIFALNSTFEAVSKRGAKAFASMFGVGVADFRAPKTNAAEIVRSMTSKGLRVLAC